LATNKSNKKVNLILLTVHNIKLLSDIEIPVCAPQHGNKTAGIDINKELTSVSSYG